MTWAGTANVRAPALDFGGPTTLMADARHRSNDRTIDTNGPVEKIDITALEPKDFATTQLTPRREKDGEPITARCRFDRGRNLCNRRDRTLDRASESRTSHLARVSGEQAVRYGRIEAGP
jgi:hypothetical protein